MTALDIATNVLSAATNKLGGFWEGTVQIIEAVIEAISAVIKWATALAVGLTWWVTPILRAGLMGAATAEDGEMAPVDVALTAVAGTAMSLSWSGLASVIMSAGEALVGWSNL